VKRQYWENCKSKKGPQIVQKKEKIGCDELSRLEECQSCEQLSDGEQSTKKLKNQATEEWQ